MIAIIKYLMDQKLLINLLVFLLIIAGLVSLGRINREAFPDVNFDMVSITTIYPGASPDELEQLVTIPLEKRLKEVGDIDKVRSYNIENVSVIVVYIEDDASDKKQVVQDIKDAVSLEDQLPDTTQKPVVQEIKLDKKFIMDVAIYGSEPGTSYATLRKVADDMEDYLYEIEGVAEVEQIGYLDREYLVEVNPAALKNHRIGMNTVINTLRNRNMDVPGGSLKVGDSEYILRTKGQYNNVEEVRNTTIMANDAGFATRIRDVARVTDTFKETTVYERFNGRKAIIFRIWKKRTADEIRLADIVKNYIDNSKNVLPAGINAEIFNDISRYTRERISSLLINAAVGFVLLAGVMFLLMGPRISAIVSITIPVSFMVAFLGMKSGGITLNVISMFGMMMVLGMIVDFGIVVSENGHRYMEYGLPRRQAILKGVSEVVWPATVTLLCITAAFAPLLFLTGIMGKFIKAIPIVLIICLFASWAVAMFIMPTYLNTFAKESSIGKDELKSEDPHYEHGFFGKFQRRYKRFLTAAIEHRYLTLLCLVILLIGSLSLVATKQVKFVFMAGGGAEAIEILTKLPQGTNIDANLRESKKLEEIIMKLPGKELDALHVSVGDERSSPLDPKPGQGTHKSTFSISLSKEKDRDRSAYAINDGLRAQIALARKKGTIPDTLDIRSEVKENGPPVGKPVNIEIRGKDFAVLMEIANQYVSYLKKIDNVYDVTIDFEEGKQEYLHVINDVMAARTHVSAFDAAMALNSAFEGAVATSVHDGKDDIDIRVRFPESARENTTGLDQVMIGNQMGGLLPLNLVTDIKKRPGYSQINRLNYKRLVQVQANCNQDKITSQEINRLMAEKFSGIEKRYPGYSVIYGGEKEDTEKSMGELGVLFIFAVIIIFIILAVFMESLILPIVVMGAIPFAITGIILAVWSHRQPLGFMSVLGFFSLAGVIVSNTLVLVQFINNQRDTGLLLKESVIEAGVIRLRPILLTSGTTVLGLIPTIYGLGGKDYFVAPLGLAFGYGLVFATFITLVLIPCFYHIAEDLKIGASRLLALIGISMHGEIYRGRAGDRMTHAPSGDPDAYDESSKSGIPPHPRGRGRKK
ncbi:MAG: efflux RND transporter permease subunit [Chrysiogenales bacterium]|nr:MAG: efflux RND transporter permease subunit [Chrysiogenales bacterium]